MKIVKHGKSVRCAHFISRRPERGLGANSPNYTGRNFKTIKERKSTVDFETPGLTYKPLYKIQEVCTFLQFTRPTIYDWIKEGKLKPYKIKSRVYFLYQDIQQLLEPKTN